MSHRKPSVISTAAQVETALQLGTTAVRFYQYISVLSGDNLEISLVTNDGHTTLNGVIQTLGRFNRDISAGDPTITDPLLFYGLSKVVKGCKRDCESVQDGVQAWLRDTQNGCTPQVRSEPLTSLSDIIAKSYEPDMDGDAIRRIHLEREWLATEKLLDILKYAQADQRRTGPNKCK